MSGAPSSPGPSVSVHPERARPDGGWPAGGSGVEELAAFGPAPAGEDPILSSLAAIALEAARAAADIARDAAGGALEVETKSSATDLVSDVDRRCERAVAATIARHRPEDGMLGEEGGERSGSSGVRWVVDPLDGTTNYVFGVPAWAVSVAAEVGGRAVVGVVVDPSHDETWTAVAGRGARCNGRPVHTPAGRSGTLGEALVGTGFGYSASRRSWQAEVLRTVLPAVRDIRRVGAAAIDLCWVAAGRLDAFYEWGLRPWDVAAAALIAAEAGAQVGALGRDAGQGTLAAGSAAPEAGGGADGPALWWAAAPGLAEEFVDLVSRAGADRPPQGA